MKNQKVILHSTYQPNTYYTSGPDAPKYIIDALLNTKLEFFTELSGGGVKLETEIEIDSERYTARYTIYYSQDFSNDFPQHYTNDFQDENIDAIEDECLMRASEFLACHGINQDIYLEAI